ncbi:MAG: nucleotide exchange factor GrpE [Syntrophaceae bacterium]|nr:nucleotide exchange factor GrpE [Syntrophaceae bacterium]
MAKKGKTEATEAQIAQKGVTPQTAQDGEPPVSAGQEEDPLARFKDAEEKAAAHYDKYVRALAELENYKKRAAREKAEAIQYGNEALLRDILPLVGSMDRAMEQIRNSKDFEAFMKGLCMLREQLLGCLRKHGVEPIETTGKPFDPHVHEAMMQVDSDVHKEGDVVDEFERGYLLNGRLLRAAKVSVCKGGKIQDCREAARDGENN